MLDSKLAPAYEAAGLIFHHRPMDRSAIDEVCVLDVYGLKDRQLSGTVIDVGAHIGSFSMMVKRLFPHVHVIAFEPNVENIDLLERNCLENGVEVSAYRLAVWGELQTMQVQGEGPTSYTVPGGDVFGITLDEVLEKHEEVDLLKLDCEGAEVSAILGAHPTTMHKIKSIVGEFHGLSDDWGQWARYLAAFFDLKIRAHDYPDHPYGGMFWGERRAV